MKDFRLKNQVTANKYAQYFLLIFLFIVSLTVLEPKRTTNLYYFDEVSWICNSRVWGELTQSRWNSGVWTEDTVQRLNPQFAKYLLGIWIYPKYGSAGFTAFGCPGWGGLMFISGLEALNQTQKDILFWARMPAMWAGISSLILIYFIGRRLFNSTIGFFTALLTLFNPLFQQSTNRAMPDSLLLLLMLFCVLLMTQQLSREQNIFTTFQPLTAGLWGVLFGMAISTKTYGILTFFLFLVLSVLFNLKLLLKPKWKYKAIYTRIVGNFLATTGVMVGIVYALNPVFWASFSAFTHWFSDWQLFQVGLQKYSISINQNIALLTPVERFIDIWNAFILPGQWNTILLLPLISAIVFLIGLFCLCLFMAQEKRSKQSTSFLLVWFGVLFSSFLLYIPFKFERYYLPLVPVITMITAVGIYKIGQSCAKQLQFFPFAKTPKSRSHK
ncbi:MAG: Glycosyl transferase family 39 [Candidatus Gottesmanbacteria bacterium GW2011_GWB1_43_11]|uniref:Glycosyl transferase family 39 n=1 Tax=Candidatus Gottesmanbacteria bacterium GW2011_GWB1_43_11 TaxID=1618446 RepID=A0A0G1CI17_9BACT|nr:MAG: Glycosyl transferase family 39 [Candidatus Gottesmanbacteria bacterium GW2011_GWA1_42_26]KKS80871.1 MAG: Glycosyl transferase family 39 [Candidatus Gottesmanbacteria bacterium GW2011_GWC1_43_10]KKS85099.1 MAG: Glycosyl transferase family 39 [Candidatus Gottesmanbacteria bacterium GW2011_GWB1_43_11]OGG07643.1 MAG: hypothetical protein A2699_06130 [Candidatus Gottesmanbacteria bacterium RIFCSPHIGHO2_01_FULL_43_15]HCM38294.1 hypothetical protein [Patescibacteria group bacterium]